MREGMTLLWLCISLLLTMFYFTTNNTTYLLMGIGIMQGNSVTIIHRALTNNKGS